MAASMPGCLDASALDSSRSASSTSSLGRRADIYKGTSLTRPSSQPPPSAQHTVPLPWMHPASPDSFCSALHPDAEQLHRLAPEVTESQRSCQRWHGAISSVGVFMVFTVLAVHNLKADLSATASLMTGRRENGFPPGRRMADGGHFVGESAQAAVPIHAELQQGPEQAATIEGVPASVGGEVRVDAFGVHSRPRTERQGGGNDLSKDVHGAVGIGNHGNAAGGGAGSLITPHGGSWAVEKPESLQGSHGGRAPSAQTASANKEAAGWTMEASSTTLVKPNPLRCNLTAPVPKVSKPRAWRLGVAWRRVCEQKQKRDRRPWYPFERNWCWVGFKAECHAKLKSHRSWTTIQETAAQEGNTPPVSRAPFFPLEFPEVCDRPHFGMSKTWTQEEWSKSYAWGKQNVAVYVLNLPQDSKRWETISARLEVLNIKAHRVLGVDMRIPGSLWTAKHAGWVPNDFRFEHAQQVANEPRQQMGSILGTLGCASAHFKVQTKAIIDNSPIAVVLEDDSWLEDDFIPRLWNMVTTELPCDWEAVALMSRCPYGVCVSPHLVRVQPDGNEPAWRCRQGVNWGMHGVMYRIETLPSLQEKWKAAVFDEMRPHCMDVDVALASISDKVGFYAVPAVQKPGFLREMDEGSSRFDINMGAQR